MRSTQKLLSFALLSVAAIGVPARPVSAAAVPVQRFLLVVGANAGGADRAKLQYAISDAERFARVMVELGGVLPANEVLLKQPRLKELMDALDALNTRVANARRAKDTGRIEVVVYYSGHADEQGLLLDGDRYAYRTLRDWLDAIPADVRIAVLDACASGAFTRLKGGKLRPPFLVDESATMRGHAFLTSSAETEAAQESDRIRASYFTHYLVSGFRGAADLSGDGKVTLNEAYQFALHETVGRTIDTRGGAQHPSYDINLSGSGDLVMTDVRQTTATIVLGEDLDGRIFVRNAARDLVVEVSKSAGRRLELGVEPGEYDVRLERPKASMSARTRVADGASVMLEARQFGPAALEPTRARGDHQTRIPFAVNGRHRVDFQLGGYFGQPTDEGAFINGMNALAATRYLYYLREDLAVSVRLYGLGGLYGRIVGSDFHMVGTGHIYGMPVGMRWNPLTRPASVFKPWVGASIGPYFGDSSGVFKGSDDDLLGLNVSAMGGQVGGGIDVHARRSFMFGFDAGYRWMQHPIGGRDFTGAEAALTFGFLFGKGR